MSLKPVAGSRAWQRRPIVANVNNTVKFPDQCTDSVFSWSGKGALECWCVMMWCALAAAFAACGIASKEGDHSGEPSGAVEVSVAAITVATIDGEFEDNYDRACVGSLHFVYAHCAACTKSCTRMHDR